ncbi:uroporphyrinogen-III C-methyltransferase [Tropicibacter oceani]|uniref:uroporphyrinogen-III C-methyltransferase n=1 Tax=Tropicibacter oceani TaxID=3058420 RepID=A0ABY8QF34_9RHOB|nr:uroporphyrinogen-III C-methyltransferase [Tropicibacter oceani]WGW02616.1 uroporphyrinogen-III C-methyltransferase [Tropicibacter oceani]
MTDTLRPAPLRPATVPAGQVCFVGAGPGDADLLTLKAARALSEAEVILYDRLVSDEILALANRDAHLVSVGKEGFGPSMTQQDINRLLVLHALSGARVLRLKGGDPAIFGRLDEEIEALEAEGIGWSVVPGITAASASVAAIGQSLTKRGRNASLRILTGHVMEGFADQDWRALARPGEVAAIYMGKKAAHFIQGRLMMHGASADTPVTFVENASRADQRIVASTLGTLAQDLAQADLSGPALTLFGLAPRAARQALPAIRKQEVS